MARKTIVSTTWLAKELAALRPPKVIDASYHMPATKRIATREFLEKHIPTARFFDVDGVKDETTDLPHMLPTATVFANAMSSLGVSNDDHVVVYDCSDFGLFSAARLWWMLRVFGHYNVSVLDGGLATWLRENRPVEAGPPAIQPALFRASEPDMSLVRNMAQVSANLSSKKELYLDARAAGRFIGTDPEPRPNLPSGHIPGTSNLPFPSLIDPATKTFYPADRLRAIFSSVGVNADTPVMASCGSGVTACVIALAADIAFPGKQIPVYDGAWAEWAAVSSNPIESVKRQ